MKKSRIGVAPVLLFVLLASSAWATPRETREPLLDRAVKRISSVVRSFFGVASNLDGLHPPLPAPCTTSCP